MTLKTDIEEACKREEERRSFFSKTPYRTLELKSLQSLFLKLKKKAKSFIIKDDKKNTSEKCNSAISPLISHNEYSSKDAFYNNLVKWKKKCQKSISLDNSHQFLTISEEMQN